MSMALTLAAAVVLVILPAVASEAITFKTCDDAPNNVEEVDLSPCSSQPCKFKHNITVTVTIRFTSGEDTQNLTTRIYGVVAGVPVPFATPQPNACKGDNVSCPLKKGQKYKYINSLYVRPTYPSLKLVVRWKLIGDSGSTVLCFNFPMEVVDDHAGVPMGTLLRQQISQVDLKKSPGAEGNTGRLTMGNASAMRFINVLKGDKQKIL